MIATPKKIASKAFTLVELLIVIAIIAILASLVLAAAGGVQKKGARSRAEAEIAAIGAALEAYKADNGDYPINIDSYLSPINNSNLVIALMPTTNGVITTTNTGKIYYEFKSKSLSANTPPGIGFIDPFGNVYGYYYNSNSYSTNNGSNNYDLWSTAGNTNDTNPTHWIKNW